jgi:hypothetical protein
MALSAILSDTLEFRSPTTTRVDRQLAEQLAQDLGVDIPSYAAEMFEAKSDVSHLSEAELLRLDSKEYSVDGTDLRISVLETVAPQAILRRKDALVAAMPQVAAEDGADQVLLFVVDILKEEATLLVPTSSPGGSPRRPSASRSRATPWSCPGHVPQEADHPRAEGRLTRDRGHRLLRRGLGPLRRGLRGPVGLHAQRPRGLPGRRGGDAGLPRAGGPGGARDQRAPTPRLGRGADRAHGHSPRLLGRHRHLGRRRAGGALPGAVGSRIWFMGAPTDRVFLEPPRIVADPIPVEEVPLAEAEGIVCCGPFDPKADLRVNRPDLLLAKHRASSSFAPTRYHRGPG